MPFMKFPSASVRVSDSEKKERLVFASREELAGNATTTTHVLLVLAASDSLIHPERPPQVGRMDFLVKEDQKP